MIDRSPDAGLEPRVAAPASGRPLLVELYEAAVAGAAPAPITTEALRDFDTQPGQQIWLYVFGKAAHPMAAAA
ncbi:MAG TPA: hypothetical protein VMZ33_07940, partial [Candidatus Limnocylindrales bacterium]|nr:hypothetical protein [Candidatus Limnocylindrales bacterium]